MIIRWSRIIDAIAAYFIKRSERKPDEPIDTVADYARKKIRNDILRENGIELDRVKFRSEIWDGNKHTSIF